MTFTFCVMSLGPVVTSSRLSKDKVVRSENLTKRSRSDAVHGAGLQVHQDGPGHVLATGSFVVVDIDSLQLKLRSSRVGSSWVYSVLIRDDLPELKKKYLFKCEITECSRIKISSISLISLELKLKIENIAQYIRPDHKQKVRFQRNYSKQQFWLF